MACGSSADETSATGPGGAGGGGGSGGAGGGGGAPVEACPEQHEATTSDGHAVVVCDALHGEAPFVRPPDDSPGAAFIATDGIQVFVRGEAPRALTPDERVLLGVDATSTGLDVRRHAFAIYRATLDDAGAVTASVPAVLVRDALLLGFLAGKSAEGLISRHAQDADNPSFEYEQEPSLPLRVSFGEPEPMDEPDAAYELVDRAALPITIENLTQPATASTGDCQPALSDAGAENPLDGAAPVALRATRVPAMHGPGDNEFVIDGAGALNHMAPPWMVLPHRLLLDAGVDLGDSDFIGHGNPLSMPRLVLDLVEGGGGACTP